MTRGWKGHRRFPWFAVPRSLHASMAHETLGNQSHISVSRSFYEHMPLCTCVQGRHLSTREESPSPAYHGKAQGSTPAGCRSAHSTATQLPVLVHLLYRAVADLGDTKGPKPRPSCRPRSRPRHILCSKQVVADPGSHQHPNINALPLRAPATSGHVRCILALSAILNNNGQHVRNRQCRMCIVPIACTATSYHHMCPPAQPLQHAPRPGCLPSV